MPSDAIEAATHFDAAVRSTAVVGELLADVKTLRADMKEVKEDTKHIRSRIDNWAGRSFILGAIISFGTTILVSIYGQQIAHAVALVIVRTVGQ